MLTLARRRSIPASQTPWRRDSDHQKRLFSRTTSLDRAPSAAVDAPRSWRQLNRCQGLPTAAVHPRAHRRNCAGPGGSGSLLSRSCPSAMPASPSRTRGRPDGSRPQGTLAEQPRSGQQERSERRCFLHSAFELLGRTSALSASGPNPTASDCIPTAFRRFAVTSFRSRKLCPPFEPWARRQPVLAIATGCKGRVACDRRRAWVHR